MAAAYVGVDAVVDAADTGTGKDRFGDYFPGYARHRGSITQRGKGRPGML